MTILVAYQWAPDPEEASVGPDGVVDFSRAKAVISDYDATAIHIGRQLADNTGTELVGVCVSAGDAASSVATKAALARGLDKVIVVTDPNLAKAGTVTPAKLIAAVVRQTGDVTVLLTGDTSIDSGSRMLPPVVGGLLGWPVVAEAITIELAGTGIRIERTVPGGVQELALTEPAVVAVSADAAQPKAPGMKDVMAAGKKPAVLTTPADWGVLLTDEGDLRSTGRVSIPARRLVHVDTTDPGQAATELVGTLRALGVLDD